MSSRRSRSIARAAGLVAAAWMVAAVAMAEDAIPIAGPTTITASGNYVVTSDFYSSGNAITITLPAGDSGVSIDLNGHTISGDIVKTPGAWDLSLTLSNGKIYGDIYRPTGLAAPLVPFESAFFHLTNVTAGSISAEPGGGATLIDSYVGSVYLSGNISQTRVIAESSNVSSIELWAAQSSRIQGSVIGNVTLSNGDQERANNLIEFSHVGNVNFVAFASGLTDTTSDVIRYCVASSVSMTSVSNTILGNWVLGGPITGKGYKSTFDGNVVSGSPTYGLIFTTDAEQNTYKNNVLSGNALGPVQDQGFGNVNGGGNVP